MSTSFAYPHLTVSNDGQVLIGGGRYTVRHLAGEHYHFGWSAEEILRQHPDLRPEEVYAALTYFYDHYNELVAKLEESAKSNRSGKTAEALSRDELLRRKKLADPP